VQIFHLGLMSQPVWEEKGRMMGIYWVETATGARDRLSRPSIVSTFMVNDV
jgi:hypothetical protein